MSSTIPKHSRRWLYNLLRFARKNSGPWEWDYDESQEDGDTLDEDDAGRILDCYEALDGIKNPSAIKSLVEATQAMLADYDYARSEWSGDALDHSDLISQRVREGLEALERS